MLLAVALLLSCSTSTSTTTRRPTTTTTTVPRLSATLLALVETFALNACSNSLEFGYDPMEIASLEFVLWENERVNPLPDDTRTLVLRSIGATIRDLCPELVPR